MPQNAINTGMVDYVAPAYDLPGLLVDFEKSYSQLMSKKARRNAKSVVRHREDADADPPPDRP